MLFDFDPKYRVVKSNQVADALGQQPANPYLHLSHQMMRKNGKPLLMRLFARFSIITWTSKLPRHLKHEVQTNITDVERANQSLGFKPLNVVDVQLYRSKSSTQPRQRKWQSCRRKTISCQ